VKSIMISLAILLITGLLALLIVIGTNTTETRYLVWYAFAAAFGIQWLAYIPACLLATEKFFDLTGSLTYLSICWGLIYLNNELDTAKVTVAILISLWCLRLGTFLVRRILQDGEDKRFKDIKISGTRFFLTWTLQGSWVFLTMLSSICLLTSQKTIPPSDPVFIVGVLIWCIGFAIETIADQQKNIFKNNPNNELPFINHGLWSRSQHPNYFGEIVLWTGLTVAATPYLVSLTWLGMISPIFVYFLLTRVSGIPLLDESANRKWGHLESYREYTDNTPKLFPKWF